MAIDHNRNDGYSQHIETRISKKRYNDRCWKEQSTRLDGFQNSDHPSESQPGSAVLTLRGEPVVPQEYRAMWISTMWAMSCRLPTSCVLVRSSRSAIVIAVRSCVGLTSAAPSTSITTRMIPAGAVSAGSVMMIARY